MKLLLSIFEVQHIESEVPECPDEYLGIIHGVVIWRPRYPHRIAKVKIPSLTRPRS